MKNLNIKPFIYLFVIISVVIFVITTTIRGYKLTEYINLLKVVPIVVTVDGFIYLLFIRWIWRWKFLQGWLVPFPDLNGTWDGIIQTNWRDKNGIIPGPIPTLLTIKQSFGRISCVMRTAEMVSRNYSEGFCLNMDEQKRQICFSYTSRPSVLLRDRSTPHDGTALLDIVGTKELKLHGEYWTQRGTSGTLTFNYYSREVLQELPNDFPQHPIHNSND